MTIETLVWLIPLPPLLAFFLIVLFTHRQHAFSHTLAVGAAFLSWAASMVVFIYALGVDKLGEHPIVSSIHWLATGTNWFDIGIQIDPLSTITLFFFKASLLIT